METLSKVVVGVDISKNNLDLYFEPVGKFLKVSNSKPAIKKLIKELKLYDVSQIALEATGGYEKLLVKTLIENSYKPWIVDPRRIKGFIVATGCKSKTDKIDAQKIAAFATKNTREYEPILKTQNQELLQALVNRKNDLTTILASEKARLLHPSHALYASNIKKCIKFLTGEIKVLDNKIQELVTQEEELNKKVTLLESIPGIGRATAALLVAFVPELGTLSHAKISALVGLCPYVRESGSYKGKRFIRGGRVTPRNALYMCALTTIKYHLPLKTFYDRLIANKKPFKVAIVAVMRKLIIIANAILKKGEPCKA